MNETLKDQITETFLNPPTGLSVGAGVGVFNTIITQLPTVINIVTVVYLLILIGHKSWTFYREWKATKDAPVK